VTTRGNGIPASVWMKEPDQEMASALAAIGGEFRPNELAYLAATMKVEAAIRDRLAFRLHQDYEPSGYIVAREWNRVDLAVLDPAGAPLALVEFKAMYTFDAFGNLRHFTDATTADELKAQRLAVGGTAVYSLLLATHLGGTIEPQFLKPVKYSGGINRAITKHGDAAAVRAQACETIDKHLAARAVVARGEVEGGAAFGQSASVLYWLVRNDGHATMALE
jgi:hypothetical protein